MRDQRYLCTGAGGNAAGAERNRCFRDGLAQMIFSTGGGVFGSISRPDSTKTDRHAWHCLCLPSGEAPPAFLGVDALGVRAHLACAARRARRGARYRDNAAPRGVSELLARVLAGRGVEPDAVTEFLDPTVRRLMPDPDTLTDMPKAAARIADAVERRERIAIFGDYDVDGATSAAVLAKFLRHRRLRAADPHPGPAVRRLRPEHRGGARACRKGRARCWSRSIAAPPASSRSPRRKELGLDVVVDRSSSGRRGAAAGRRAGQSEPARRSLGAQSSRGGAALCS